MKKMIYFLVIFQLFFSPMTHAQGTHNKKKSNLGNYYWEYLPPAYDSTKKCPTIFFLHGCGEIAYRSGSDCPPENVYQSDPYTELDKLLRNGIPKEIKNGRSMCFTIEDKTECFIVISPQLNNGYFSTSWDPRKLDSFIEEMKDKYPIDLNRVYLTGLSLGGIGTWNYSLRHPDKLAAIVPISGNASGSTDLACNISKIPVWAFHDDPDGVVATSGTTSMENKIKACPGNITPKVTLIRNYQADTITPKSTHSAWNIAYSSDPSPANTPTRKIIERPVPLANGTTIYNWLLSKKRTATGPLVNVEEDKKISTLSTTIKATVSLEDTTASIVSYSWQYVPSSGSTQPLPVLEGANTTTLTVKNLTGGNLKYRFRLTVTDSRGYIDTDEMLLTVNLLPVVHAGDDQILTLPQNSTTLNGSASDPDGTISKYAWSVVKKPGTVSPVMSGITTSSLAVSNLVQGDYIFRLKATDNAGSYSVDDVMVRVLASSSNSVSAIKKKSEEFNELESNTAAVIVSPVPFKNKICLKFNTKIDGKVSVEISDVYGKVHYKTVELKVEEGSLTDMDLSQNNLSNGIYIIKVKSNQGFEKVIKIMKE